MNHENNDKSQSKAAKLLLVTYAMRKASYMIRGLAGGYLVYLMYQLFSESRGREEELTPFLIGAGIFMMIAGVYFVIGALYALANGIYDENRPSERTAEEDVIEANDTEADDMEPDNKESGDTEPGETRSDKTE